MVLKFKKIKLEKMCFFSSASRRAKNQEMVTQRLPKWRLLETFFFISVDFGSPLGSQNPEKRQLKKKAVFSRSSKRRLEAAKRLPSHDSYAISLPETLSLRKLRFLA